MIHTATFICSLTSDELNAISSIYFMDINTLLCELDNDYTGITSHIVKKYNYTLYISIDFIKLLGTPIITTSHYSDCERIINTYLNKLRLSLHDLTLIRIDYRMDFIIKSKVEREVLLNCFKKALNSYRMRTKNTTFNSTIYFSNKSVQTTVYDKEIERLDNNCFIESYERNILRFEVRLLNKHLNTNKQKYKIEKTLKNYFSENKQKQYFEKYIFPVFFLGDFYSFSKAKEIINNSNIKQKDKDLLIKFIATITYKGLNSCKSNLTDYKYRKALKHLNELNINPLTITHKGIDKLKNPFTISIS